MKQPRFRGLRPRFNCWWGCTHAGGPGCDNCYAETFAHRLGMDLWGQDADRRFFGDKHWAQPLAWNRKAAAAGEPWRVFCASMCDVFEDLNRIEGVRSDMDLHLDVERQRLWELIEQTPHLTWMLLTKRPQNVRHMVPLRWLFPAGPVQLSNGMTATVVDGLRADAQPVEFTWPPNVWVGTTVENQRYADLRIPQLLEVPAPVRFLSVEPMLGPVNLSRWLGGEFNPVHATDGDRGDRLSGSRGGMDRDQGGRFDLADSSTTQESMGRDRDDQTGASGADRRPGGSGLPARQADGRRGPDLDGGASAGMASLQRSDSRGADDQPPQRTQGRQPADQSRTGDIPGTGPTRDRRTGSPSAARQPARGEEPHGEADDGSGRGDQAQEGNRRATDGDSRGFRRGLPDGVEDRSGRPTISWLIVGGESGAHARRMDPAWAAGLRDQCAAAGVPFFFKQTGAVLAKEWGCSSKGDVPAEWPTEFQIQEFPA